MTLPKQYADLRNEPGPKMLIEALKHYGVYEVQGSGDSDIILQWAKHLGLQKVYSHDETAWCGLFMAKISKDAGKVPVKDPLWALNWAKFGMPALVPMLGDVLVKKRYDSKGRLVGGHVTLYVGEDANYYHCIGGNQMDSVSITRILKTSILAARRPIYNNQPANVRVIKRSPVGEVSIKEA